MVVAAENGVWAKAPVAGGTHPGQDGFGPKTASGTTLAAKGAGQVAKTVGHHTIPREILRQLPDDVANAIRGKRGAPNIWQIPEDLHKAIHGGPGGGLYNQRWKEELGKLRPEDITPENVLRIRDRLVYEFGIGGYR